MMKKNNTGTTIHCHVCKLDPAKRHKVELELVSGHSYASIGRRFDIDPYWVSMHGKNHMASRALERSRETRIRIQSINLIAEIEAAMERINKVLDKAERRGQHQTFIQGIQQLRGYHTLLAQMQATAYQAQLAERKAETEDKAGDFKSNEEEVKRAIATLSPEEQAVLSKVTRMLIGRSTGFSDE